MPMAATVGAVFREHASRGAGVQMDSARPTLQRLVAEVLNRLPAEQVPLEAWQFACGKQVAERTRAVSFGGGVLRVEVPDVRWQDQLRELSGGYLANLNRYSATRIERIEFVVAASTSAVNSSASAAAKPGPKRGPTSKPKRESRWRKQK